MNCSNPNKDAGVPLVWPFPKTIRAPYVPHNIPYVERMSYIAVAARKAFKELEEI